MNGSPSYSPAGAYLFGGAAPPNATPGESEEERRKRLLAVQQAQERLSPAGRALMGAGYGSALSGSYGGM